jgi:RNA polymerase sigma factor (TIGR02999 family)
MSDLGLHEVFNLEAEMPVETAHSPRGIERNAPAVLRIVAMSPGSGTFLRPARGGAGKPHAKTSLPRDSSMSDSREQSSRDDGLPPVSRDAGVTVDQMIPLIYNELRRIAHHRLRAEQTGHTLETTGLVHEAYLRLVGGDALEFESRAHLLAIAAQAMRHVLIDSAVSRKAKKRGGGKVPLSLDDAPIMAETRSEDLLALDEALQRLSAMDERQARVVECRYFGGMSIEETAAALGTSPATVKRDWVLARAWLNRELHQ